MSSSPSPVVPITWTARACAASCGIVDRRLGRGEVDHRLRLREGVRADRRSTVTPTAAPPMAVAEVRADPVVPRPLDRADQPRRRRFPAPCRSASAPCGPRRPSRRCPACSLMATLLRCFRAPHSAPDAAARKARRLRAGAHAPTSGAWPQSEPASRRLGSVAAPAARGRTDPPRACPRCWRGARCTTPSSTRMSITVGEVRDLARPQDRDRLRDAARRRTRRSEALDGAEPQPVRDPPRGDEGPDAEIRARAPLRHRRDLRPAWTRRRRLFDRTRRAARPSTRDVACPAGPRRLPAAPSRRPVGGGRRAGT